jgi:hypothetical protein
MGATLQVFGPFKVTCEKGTTGPAKQVGKEHIKSFWDEEASCCATKQGCYVFALKAGRGYTPWYVGKATKSFKQECFQADKLVRYNNVLFKGQKGTPVLFFVAPGGNKNKVPMRIIDEMENFLIQAALYENPQIKNVAKTKNVPKWGINGVVRGGKGKPDTTSKAFAKMVGL